MLASASGVCETGSLKLFVWILSFYSIGNTPFSFWWEKKEREGRKKGRGKRKEERGKREERFFFYFFFFGKEFI